ncbi:TPA: Ig-like domain-containing protein [Photobacterium damselae]
MKLSPLFLGLLISSQTFAAIEDNQFVVPDQFNIHSAEPQLLDVLANDLSDNLTIDEVVGVNNGTVSNDAIVVQDNKILFTPPQITGSELVAQYLIVYYASNEDGIRETGVVNINYDLAGLNRAPVTVNDHAYALAGKPITVDVLANDYDLDQDDHLRLVSVGGENGLQNGGLGIIQDNKILANRYITDQDRINLDYVVEDQYGAQSQGKLTVDFLPKALIAVKDKLYNVPKHQRVVLDVLANDLVSDNAYISHGFSPIKNIIKVEDGQLIFEPTPDFDYTQPVKFGYQVTDGGHTASAMGELVFESEKVNHAPVANPDNLYKDEITNLILNPLDNDVDIDNDNIKLVDVFTNDGEVQIMNDRQIVFMPSEGNSPSDNASILYSISDEYDNISFGSITIRYK